MSSGIECRGSIQGGVHVPGHHASGLRVIVDGKSARTV
jgi:hypothetical protein